MAARRNVSDWAKATAADRRHVIHEKRGELHIVKVSWTLINCCRGRGDDGGDRGHTPPARPNNVSRKWGAAGWRRARKGRKEEGMKEQNQIRRDHASELCTPDSARSHSPTGRVDQTDEAIRM